jgi:hypothetical protein
VNGKRDKLACDVPAPQARNRGSPGRKAWVSMKKSRAPAGQHTAVDGLRLKAWFLPV